MTNSGFTTRKLELDYDKSVLKMCELLAYKVIELVKVVDHAGIDTDESPVCTHKHIHWAGKFLESFKSVYKMEKHKYQEPKFTNTIKPLA